MIRNRNKRWTSGRRLERPVQHLRAQRSRWTWFALGGAVGAATAFFVDPQLGTRRRALARDRSLGAVRRVARRTGRGGRTVAAYSVGWTRRLRHLREERKNFDDATLAQKVQTELFRPADAPKGDVNVNVVDGVVQLRGQVERPELIEELIERTRKMQGVREVESYLHLPGTPVPSRS
jgi:gas vesicle protein